MKRFTLSICALVLVASLPFNAQAFCLFNCEPAKPTEADGQAKLEKLIRKKLNRYPFRITQFRKTNGSGGGSYYSMEYFAEVTFPDGIQPECKVRNRPMQCIQYAAAGQVAFTDDFLQKIFRFRSRGERFSGNGVLTLHKTENGWR
jgi:hypothetical protein